MAVSNASQIFNLLDVSRGVGINDRLGARLHLRALEMKWDVYASDSTNTIRCMILIDKQGNGVAPT